MSASKDQPQSKKAAAKPAETPGVQGAATVTPAQAGFRADRALAALETGYNRREARALCRAGLVRLNGAIARGAERVEEGHTLTFPASTNPDARAVFEGQARMTTRHGRQVLRLYEDQHLMVIHKPAEIPIHHPPEGKSRRETLEDVFDKAIGPGKYYFVHRLDMETTGCLLVAKNAKVRDALMRMFEKREIRKTYIAFTGGEVTWESKIVKRPIIYVQERVNRRTEAQRRKEKQLRLRKGSIPEWAALKASPLGPMVKKGKALEEGDEAGKSCETRFKVLERFKGVTLMRCDPRTGRMHQIRVHLLSEGYPLCYDPLYGRRTPWRAKEFIRTKDEEAGDEIVLNRLPLHAWKLRFIHPMTKEELSVAAPLPRDLKDFLRLMRKHRK